jgi:hypothetical protein
MAEAVGYAVVGAAQGYAYSVLLGISLYNIDRLRHIQSLLVLIVTATVRRRPTVNSQKLLNQLHWLPVKYRIQYKLAILAYRSQSLTAPLSLCSLISLHQSPRIVLLYSD